MKVRMDCVPCYLQQVLSAIKIGKYPEEKAKDVFQAAMRVIPLLDPDASPAENSTLVLQEAYRAMDLADPFHEAKQESNAMAQKLYPRLKKLVEKAEDPLLAAFKVAVAGNIIDMGIMPDFDLNQALAEITEKEFALCHYHEFKACLQKAEKVMILGDNSGEIVFDKLLVMALKALQKHVIYVVKAAPILNDVTMEDAAATGMAEIAEVMTNGAGFLGTVIHRCSQEFLEAFAGADLVIGKGQANFESLEGTKFAGTKTFFIFRAKCNLVADCAGVKFGDTVFLRNKIKTLK